MNFGALFRDAEPATAVDLGPVAERTVEAVVYDSRQARPGSVFCCVPGSRHDGHLFAPSAVAAGSEVLVVEHPLGLGVPEVVVPDVRATMGRLAAALHGHPSRRLRLVGITGTNGKTTTAHVLAQVLERCGIPTSAIGTLTGRLTTPEAPELHEYLASQVAAGVEAVVMEVSSHALALSRVEGAHFTLGVFTNLGRDHLDFHGTQERYFAAKARLFESGRCKQGVINRDDLHGRLLLDAAPIPMTSFGLSDLTELVVAADHHAYTWRGQRVQVPLGARFNVENSLAAATAAAALGLEPVDIAGALAGVRPVPGRFETVDVGQPFHVVVDYAHTPDGLAGVLHAARDVAAGHRVLVVFGCGGDRDREKRPAMGETAASLADAVVITSDNPRSEDPVDIIDAVQAGVPDRYRDRLVATTPDRREGIATAFRLAEPGDVVVIAGKGHEATQTIGSEVVEFDDRVVARQLLEDLT